MKLYLLIIVLVLMGIGIFGIYDFYKTNFDFQIIVVDILIVLVVFFILGLFLYLVSLKNIIKQDNIKKKVILLDDEPLDNIKKGVEHLKNIILVTENFISMGLTGKWGSGKTSFLFSLKKKLENENIEVIYINVWKLEKTSNIIEEIEKEFNSILFRNRPILWIVYHLKSFL